MGGVYILQTPASTKEPPDQTALFAWREAAERIRRQGRRSQTRTSAHTAIARRRRAMAMVGPLVMGAGHKAGSPTVKPKCERPPRCRDGLSITVRSEPRRQRIGFHGAGDQPIAGAVLLDIAHWPGTDSGSPAPASCPPPACRRSCGASLPPSAGSWSNIRCQPGLATNSAGMVGDVGLDEHLVRAGRQHEGGVARRVAERSPPPAGRARRPCPTRTGSPSSSIRRRTRGGHWRTRPSCGRWSACPSRRRP